MRPPIKDVESKQPEKEEREPHRKKPVIETSENLEMNIMLSF